MSDRYGRIVDHKASADAAVISLEIAAPLGPGEATYYARFGYWFGWLCVAFSAFAALSLAIRSAKKSAGQT